MNKAVTDGLVLMPPAFEAGLNLWSREDGLPGQGSWANQPNAAFVPADQDFGGCLEVQKTTATLKLRSFQQIPFRPGMYLRVTARVKCLSGAFPAVRIAAFAAASNGSNVASAVQIGPSVAMAQYGRVVTISAIIGSGNRAGVNMVWGTSPAYGHIGIDLTGATGGIVRIDDIQIEDGRRWKKFYILKRFSPSSRTLYHMSICGTEGASGRMVGGHRCSRGFAERTADAGLWAAEMLPPDGVSRQEEGLSAGSGKSWAHPARRP
jgi:hypothetical protein